MAWICVDKCGIENIHKEKPKRWFGKTMDWWTTTYGQPIQMPKGTANALFNEGLLLDVTIPLDKRRMNWGDKPIEIKAR